MSLVSFNLGHELALCSRDFELSGRALCVYSIFIRGNLRRSFRTNLPSSLIVERDLHELGHTIILENCVFQKIVLFNLKF